MQQLLPTCGEKSEISTLIAGKCGPCGALPFGSAEEEVLKQAAEHAQTVHNVEVTPELAEQVKSLIRDE